MVKQQDGQHHTMGFFRLEENTSYSRLWSDYSIIHSERICASEGRYVKSAIV
jgi:hypothetical protein